MVDEALDVATDPDYRFELAIQLGRLEIAKVSASDFFFCFLVIEARGFFFCFLLVVRRVVI